MITSLKQGKIQGTVENGVARFLGIPYAEAPVGDLRFRKTVSKKSWDGIYMADHFSPKCPQLQIPVVPDNGIAQDEDCLYMNVYAPENTEIKKPVFVWIYGGALASGEGSTDYYDGSEFVKNGDIVVVNFNYRVGFFGGFYNFHSYENCENYEPNCGLYDVLEALKFVKENIAAFGGDPDRITIGGESAGAFLTALLLCMPEAKGLFAQATLESTFLFDPADPTDQTVTDKILDCAGLEASHAADFLNMTASDIMKAVFDSCGGNPLVCGTLPQKTSHFPENIAMMVANRCNDVPILIGFNHDEAMIFGTPDTPPEQIRQMTEELFESVICGFLGSEQHHSPVYLYRYDFVPAPLKAKGMGAIHAAEMPCVYHNMDCPGAAMMQADPEGAETVSRKMHQAWIDFIQGHAPWSAWQEDAGRYMCFDVCSKEKTDDWRI